MQAYVAWFVAGFILLVAELMTGTFYLLVIALAFGVAGLADLAGAPLVAQILIAALIGLGGSLALRRSRLGKAAAIDHLQHMDVGGRVHVKTWSGSRTSRANYRGAPWDVELAEGEAPVAGEFEILEVRGNRLVVKRVHVG